jgi:HSP20 family protein
MIRRTVLTAPTGRRIALSTANVPVSVWPQTPLPSFSTRWSTAPQPKAASQLPIDVFTGSDQAVIRAALPGVHPEQIEVSVYENTVTISAQLPTRNTPEGEQVTWLVAELGTGSFQRTIQLPFQIEEQEVQAEFANGLLQLILPKVEAEKPHRISIQVRPELSYELGSGESQEDESFAAD